MLNQTQLLAARVDAEDTLTQCTTPAFVPITSFLRLHKSVVLLAASTPGNTFLVAAEHHVEQAIARVVDRSGQRYTAHYIRLAVQSLLLAAEKLDGQGSTDERVRRPTDPTAAALDLIERYGGIDGAHHKQWVLDQIVRVITGPNYAAWVAAQCAGEDGPDTYSWDKGVAP